MQKTKEKNYRNPTVISQILKKELNEDMSIEELVDYVLSLDMTLTEEEINRYLEERLKEENPELKRRREEKKTEDRSLLELFRDEEEISKYILKPYILNSSKTYIDILKGKCLRALHFIMTMEKVGLAKEKKEDLGDLNETWKEVSLELESYGIEVNESARIEEESLTRLVSPLVFNIKTLIFYVERANRRETYYNMDVVKDKVPPLPDRKLQHQDPAFSHPGYIPLSDHQKERMKAKQKTIYCQK